jgi:type II secretory pathway pseudopilin PulG
MAPRLANSAVPVVVALLVAAALMMGLSVSTFGAAAASSGPGALASQANITEKLMQLQIDQARAEQARQMPKPPKPGPGALLQRAVIPPDANWPAGILQTSLSPFPPDAYTIQNHYQALVNGQHLSVFAGSLANDPFQGVVIRLTLSLDLQHSSTKVFQTADRVGSLHVAQVSGAILTLTSSTGAAFQFDTSLDLLTRVG